jgi:hypothetical protein
MGVKIIGCTSAVCVCVREGVSNGDTRYDAEKKEKAAAAQLRGKKGG